jgi:2-polyprenyl-3-methyl-5-hydroxy-6-metoxy-1,4-benzoquinol methylase
MTGKYKIIPDPAYGYLRADPLPTEEEVERYYLEEFYSSEYKRFNDSSLEVQKEELDFFNSRWEAICARCEEHFGKLEGLSVFDVGFGFAQALLCFRDRGMEASGLEPSPEGVEYARSQGLHIYQAGIEDFSCVGSRRFDIVTLLNVLEHLRSPAETLLNIKNKLIKPGGLLIIDVPNEFNDFQTVANAEFGLKEWWVCPPNHINYFSASSLSHLLADCGYNIRYRESSFPLEIFLLMGDVYVGNNELGKTCHRKRVQFEYLMKKYDRGKKLSQFYQALAELDLGRQVVFYASPR